MHKENVFRQMEVNDLDNVVDMGMILFGVENRKELYQEFLSYIDNEMQGVIFVAIQNQTYIGFAQVQLRHDYVEGTISSPVGYMEGIFIKEEFRRHGYAKKLVYKCEQWAKANGCSEFASDCEITNNESLIFHLNIGFNEVNRIICFKKQI